jgi:hypothetical protein
MTLPEVPLTESVYEPGAAFLFVLMVSTELPEPARDEGLNLPVTDFGRPVTANLIEPEKPSPAVTPTV